MVGSGELDFGWVGKVAKLVYVCPKIVHRSGGQPHRVLGYIGLCGLHNNASLLYRLFGPLWGLREGSLMGVDLVEDQHLNRGYIEKVDDGPHKAEGGASAELSSCEFSV